MFRPRLDEQINMKHPLMRLYVKMSTASLWSISAEPRWLKVG